MRQALLDGGQIILLLNRRGFDTHVHCPACGHVATCRFCDLALTFHRQRDLLLCHYCGYEQAPVRACPVCQQPTMRYRGLGTEKLETEIAERFPGVALGRMDSDTMRRSGSHERLLTQFRAGQIQILLGTQMIAKGLDFPNVTLVGVVNADVGLHVPDFRAAERTFQLLSQVAGRAGRGPRGGKVLVQTFSPEHPAIALAATHDFLRFAQGELAHRRAHHYPPYNRLARVVVRAHDPKKAQAHADRLAGAFATTMRRLVSQEPITVRLLGPAEAPVFRLKGWHRFHFQLQSPDPGALHRVLRDVLASVRSVQGVEVTVDIDPQDML
jgi:primosomal protein N' (replication factor Y)